MEAGCVVRRMYGGHRQVILAGGACRLAASMRHCLETWDFTVRHIESLLDTTIALRRTVPDLVVLLRARNSGPCGEACRAIRELSRVPVLVLCGNSAGEHVAEALRSGADDHITDSVSVSELEARVHALLRRNQTWGYDHAEQLRAGPITLDCRRAVARSSGREVELAPYEFKLLKALALRPGAMLGHNDLIEQVWGSPYHATGDNLRKLVQRLRASLAEIAPSKRIIVSVPGFGYYLPATWRKRGTQEGGR
jgi:DNA-binding response OmpR family regulator